MGTNYYFRYNICDCCDRYDQLHIGKSSYGWKFLFHAVDEYIDPRTLDPKEALLDNDDTRIVISSFQHWKKFIEKFVSEFKTAKIYDEYNCDIEPDEFFKMLNNKQGKSHYTETKSGFIDSEGYDFVDGEFS